MKPWTCRTLTSSPIARPTTAHTARVLKTAAGMLPSRPFMPPAAITVARLTT